jgi:hypothetical protein
MKTLKILIAAGQRHKTIIPQRHKEHKGSLCSLCLCGKKPLPSLRGTKQSGGAASLRGTKQSSGITLLDCFTAIAMTRNVHIGRRGGFGTVPNSPRGRREGFGTVPNSPRRASRRVRNGYEQSAQASWRVRNGYEPFTSGGVRVSEPLQSLHRTTDKDFRIFKNDGK